MNVSELARRIKISPQQLRDILPGLGFDIGTRAIKIDDRTAWKIIEDWPQLKKELEKIRVEEKPEEVKEAVVVDNRKIVALPPIITIREFAALLNLPISKVVAELMKNGVLSSMNERIDFTTASIIAGDFGFEIKEQTQQEKQETTNGTEDIVRGHLNKETASTLQPHPPVIVVMGHVDHGKTKLLDAIRKTNVVEGEAGGITQHIGAYQVMVNLKNTTSSSNNQEIPRQARDDNSQKRIVTFIDTPGHEAFTTMRSRGARVADIAILVVAADDGVQPQTLEALRIIEAVKIPFVVAVNKIDKSGTNMDLAKRQLSEKGVLPEDWGGKIPFIPISAKQGTGIDALLDVILLIADLAKNEIVANPNAQGLGTVIESHVDQGEGPVATILVQNGTLRAGEYLGIAGGLYGKIRAMKDWAGKLVTTAPPGMPVKIIGFKFAPEVGDIVEIAKNPKMLETKKVHPAYKEGVHAHAQTNKPSQDSEKENEQQLINIIVKTDVLGSLEAITSEIDKLQTAEVAIKLVSKGLGNITEADVLQAQSSKAIIYGFNVLAMPAVKDLARDTEVEIQTYKIIYELLDDLRGRLEVLLKPEIIHISLGTLKVLAIFRKEKNYVIIGGRVENGKAVKGSKIKILRDGVEQGQGEMAELQSGKKDVQEVPGGSECGMKINTKRPIAVDDVIEMYKEERRERKLVL